MRRTPISMMHYMLIGVQLVALTSVLGAALVVLRDELEIAAAEDQVDRMSHAIERNERFVATVHRRISPEAPPRALLAYALIWARSAQSMTLADTRRPAAIDQAETASRLAAQQRPYWGDVWAVRTLVASLRYGASSREVIQPFVRSYADAPFLRGSAPWRIRIGFLNWAALDERTRGHVIDEAITLLRVEPRLTADVFSAARESAAYYPFVLRWRTERMRARAMREG